MNQYSQLLKYFKELGESDLFINTIAQGRLSKAFLDKGDIYPLLHIAIDTGRFTNGNTIVFNVELTCVQQRDTNKEIVNDKFYNNDNEVDNMNEMLASLNRIWNIMYNDLCDKNILSSENPPFSQIENEYADNLDGWQLTFDVEMPNTILNICKNNECV